MKVKVFQDGSRSIPVVFCDLCDQQIEKDEIAEYLIPRTEDGQTNEIIVGHSSCTGPFDKEQFTKHGISYGNMSLGHLIFCLVSNHGVDLDSEEESHEILKGLAP